MTFPRTFFGLAILIIGPGFLLAMAILPGSAKLLEKIVIGICLGFCLFALGGLMLGLLWVLDSYSIAVMVFFLSFVTYFIFKKHHMGEHTKTALTKDLLEATDEEKAHRAWYLLEATCSTVFLFFFIVLLLKDPKDYDLLILTLLGVSLALTIVLSLLGNASRAIIFIWLLGLTLRLTPTLYYSSLPWLDSWGELAVVMSFADNGKVDLLFSDYANYPSLHLITIIVADMIQLSLLDTLRIIPPIFNSMSIFLLFFLLRQLKVTLRATNFTVLFFSSFIALIRWGSASVRETVAFPLLFALLLLIIHFKKEEEKERLLYYGCVLLITSITITHLITAAMTILLLLTILAYESMTLWQGKTEMTKAKMCYNLKYSTILSIIAISSSAVWSIALGGFVLFYIGLLFLMVRNFFFYVAFTGFVVIPALLVIFYLLLQNRKSIPKRFRYHAYVFSVMLVCFLAIIIYLEVYLPYVGVYSNKFKLLYAPLTIAIFLISILIAFFLITEIYFTNQRLDWSVELFSAYFALLFVGMIAAIMGLSLLFDSTRFLEFLMVPIPLLMGKALDFGKDKEFGARMPILPILILLSIILSPFAVLPQIQMASKVSDENWFLTSSSNLRENMIHVLPEEQTALRWLADHGNRSTTVFVDSHLLVPAETLLQQKDIEPAHNDTVLTWEAEYLYYYLRDNSLTYFILSERYLEWVGTEWYWWDDVPDAKMLRETYERISRWFSTLYERDSVRILQVA
ncbi:MAG: hypothetical protein ACE5OZ_12075 [Candidatus Heimdallarchaeota archaeon]